MTLPSMAIWTMYVQKSRGREVCRKLPPGYRMSRTWGQQDGPLSQGKVPYYTVSHTTRHATLHILIREY